MNEDKPNLTATGGKDQTTSNHEFASTTTSTKPNSEEKNKNIVLEKDIAAKQQGRFNVTAKPGAYSARDLLPNSDNVNPELRGYEADIHAKQRGSSTRTLSSETEKRRFLSTASSYSTKSDKVSADHMAYEADIHAKHSNATVFSLEQDVLAKQKGRSTAVLSAEPGSYAAKSILCSNDLRNELCSHEADVAAKQKGRLADGAHHTIIASKHQAHDELHDIEADIRAKQHAGGARKSTAIDHGDTISGLEALEANIAAKQIAHTSVSFISSPVRSNGAVAVGGDQNVPQESPLKQSRDNGALSGAIDSNLIDLDDVGVKGKKDGKNQSALQGNLNGLEYGEFGGGGGEDGLAVAFVVDDEEGADVCLPSAVEFDPDAKPPMYRNRRFRLYIFLMSMAAIIGAIGSSLGIIMTVEQDPPEVIPYRTTLGIRENIARIVSSERLDDYTSPYKKAMDWITFVDPMELTPDSPRFLNRYVLAYFYYATSDKTAWTSDCAPIELQNENCIHVFLRDDVEQSYINRTSFKWLSNSDECDWAGIHCDEFKQVRAIELSNVGLTGIFPEGLSMLPYLSKIDLRYGELEGTLPAYISNWKNLLDIELTGNKFTGSIPDAWFESRLWTYLLLPDNQITGTISGSISKFEDMIDFSFGNNKLTGSIPTEIGKLPSLAYLVLHSNALTGQIPETVGRMLNLALIDLSRNLLTGTIPETIGGCTKLGEIKLYKNLLTGSLPDGFWAVTSLLFFHAGGNMLTGSISNQLSKFKLLRIFDIENNQFTGSFPSRLGIEVHTILASGNEFNGTIAPGLCDLVDNGQIENLEFDCAAPVGGGEPEISCPADCCTACCNPDGDCVEL